MEFRQRGSVYLPHPSCQIPRLAEILTARFGFRMMGTFVEVGAFDGESFSNTSFLADLGWRGVYIEPVPSYAALCAARHRRNPQVSVVQCAVGSTEQTTELMIGSVLSSADPSTWRAYGEIDWAKGLLTQYKIAAQQRHLESILRDNNVPAAFDLLVVDVEGSEEAVFNSFDLAAWRPKMLIVELEDEHTSFRSYPDLVERARRVRKRILETGYDTIYQDEINTIFWDAASPPQGT